MANQTRKPEKLVPLFPPRKILFRAHGKTYWTEHHFTILGKKNVLDPKRSSKPMHLVAASDIEGFRSSEVVGFDLFSAIASALLMIEGIILLLQRTGDVRLSDDSEFNVSTDSVFFGEQIEMFHDVFRDMLVKKTPETADGGSEGEHDIGK